MRRRHFVTNGILGTVAGLATFELVLFWSFVVRTRMLLGYWPKPYHPDPIVTGFSLHGSVVAIVYLLAAGTVVLAPIWLLVISFFGRRPNVGWIVSTMVALSGLAFTVFVDPGQFVEWFLD